MFNGDIFLENFKLSPTDPKFQHRLFWTITKKNKKSRLKEPLVKKIILEEYADLSYRFDRSLFQDSCSVRNVLKTRRLATLLVNEEGKLQLDLVKQAYYVLKDNLYSLGPNRQEDIPRQEYILQVLEKLYQNPNLQKLIETLFLPFSNKLAEELIRETLQLEKKTILTNAHVRRACLAAWFCYLRQNVGSCFATAPAILVQQEQPVAFLKDIHELLNTGRLKRVFGGIEYAAPLSDTWGAGDLKKPILILKEQLKILHDLSYSPGLQYALEACQLVDTNLILSKRLEKGKAIILKALVALTKEDKAYFILTAEQILRFILMHHLKLTEKDLYAYENRPQSLVQTDLLINSYQSLQQSFIETCHLFLKLLGQAEVAFKSLADNALLKTWEFTFACFAETKPSFSRWNMYTSLGFNAEEKGGIAECLYYLIKQKLDLANKKVHEYQEEYEQSYNHLKYLEVRLRTVNTEKEAQWLKIEYETRRSEFRSFEEIRNQAHFKARRFAELYNDLLETYDHLFPSYFQEIYDADMHEVTTGPYDDSPAGFRLLYKYGRNNTALWSKIYTATEFINALCAFFIASEVEIRANDQFQGLESDLSDLVTQLVAHVRTDLFLISAFERLARAHNISLVDKPLENLNKIEKKPWAYTSGGTMGGLISCYFKLEKSPTEKSRWVENETELLIFLIDLVKQMPPKLVEEYLKSTNHLLIHSPTHAFLFKPSFELLKKAITDETFTYTFVRDLLVKPAENFCDSLFLDESMMNYLIKNFSYLLPENLREIFQNIFFFTGVKNPREFRQELLEKLAQKAHFFNYQQLLTSEEIDSALFAWLPLTPVNELKNRVEKVLFDLPDIQLEQKTKMEHYSESFIKILTYDYQISWLTAEKLQHICYMILSLLCNQTCFKQNYPQLIRLSSAKLGYAMPLPIFFADTNWVKNLFAFLVNPGTSNLELWRTDYLGIKASKMATWQEWLNGTRKDLTWGVYTNPYEYRI